jgi:hypothetical protein
MSLKHFLDDYFDDKEKMLSEHHVYNADSHTFTVPKSGTYKLNGTFTLPEGMTIDTSQLLPGDYISSIPYDPNGAITTATPQKMTRTETWDDLYNPKTEIKGTFKEDCKHEYLVYNGYNDSFEYCKHCDEKKKLT